MARPKKAVTLEIESKNLEVELESITEKNVEFEKNAEPKTEEDVKTGSEGAFRDVSVSSSVELNTLPKKEDLLDLQDLLKHVYGSINQVAARKRLKKHMNMIGSLVGIVSRNETQV